MYIIKKDIFLRVVFVEILDRIVFLRVVILFVFENKVYGGFFSIW